MNNLEPILRSETKKVITQKDEIENILNLYFCFTNFIYSVNY